jgi:UDP-N-acetylmuramoyl-tripeptide--D-alanyl-D-alanine ligase
LARLRADEIARAAGGRVVSGDPGTACAGAAIDSRAAGPGQIFFALRGERTDGHRFVADALARGAGAAVVQEEVEAPEGAVLILVDDTLRALQDVARLVRTRTPRHLVGITGSAGKTTTKELLAAVLESRFRVSKTAGNFNNLIGFPLCLINVPDDTEWMVAEMGMSTAGELSELSRMGRPDVAVFTVVRPVHLEFFASVAEIAEAKSELLAGLAPDGVAVANADDPEVTRIARRHRDQGGRVLWYGVLADGVDVRARDLRPAPGGEIGSRFVLEAGGESGEVALPLHGLYNAENALAAAAAAHAIGLSVAEIAAALGAVRPASMRGVVHRISLEGGPFTLIDDSYNSNPAAVERALESAASLPGARRVAVLGDMLELGPEGPRFHRESGEQAARRGFSPVVGVGELSRELVAGAEAAGAEALWLPDAATAADWAAAELRAGDLVLVKGSRGVGLDKVVRRLLPEPSEGGH